jgi:4-amino-4-deoxy-L-arabinose transferase-like glycosyltransferase
VTTRPPWARAGTGAVVVALGLFLLVLSPRYGPHRDELYFASAAHRLAWGYPDQPPLVVLLARISQALAPHNLVVLRLPSIVAVVGTVVLAAGLARLLGGDRRAQVLTAVVVATGAVTVFLGHRLTTETLEVTAWTGLALVAGHALVDDRPRLWLLAGLVAGLGLNAKHSMVVGLLGLTVGVAVTPSARHHLRSVWWWAAGLLALLLWLPNLLWQAAHGWPVFELSSDIRAEYGGLGGAIGYVAQALLIYSPVMAVVWLAGLYALLRRPEWRALRPIAWVFLVTFVFFLLSGGKAYYLAGAIVPLLAAGCVVLAARMRRVLLPGIVLALSAAVAWPAGLPLLPAPTYASSFYTAIDDDQLETIGWPQFVDTVRAALGRLPPGAIVFTGNYGEAGALEWYDVRAPVYSGHNGWGDWGPPPDGAGPVVVVGYRDLSPTVDFTGCSVAGTVPTVDGADNEEAGGKVWTCTGPRKPWSKMWSSLVHLDA